MARLDAVGIVVSDLTRSIKFYKALGLDFPDAPTGEDHIEAVTPGGLRVMLDTEEVVKSFTPDWVRPTTNSIGLAFLCETAADVDSLYQTMVADGYQSKTEPFDAFWGQRYAQLLDPDGHSVDLFASL